MWNDSFQVYICFNNVEMTANMYSELREEARDHACLRNAYFEQVCTNFMSYCHWPRKLVVIFFFPFLT